MPNALWERIPDVRLRRANRLILSGSSAKRRIRWLSKSTTWSLSEGNHPGLVCEGGCFSRWLGGVRWYEWNSGSEGRFLMGVSDMADVGKPGGSDTITGLRTGP